MRLLLTVTPATRTLRTGPRKVNGMLYAKTSLRAEQRALREKMRELGMSHRQIAVEFARRYRLRPRAAWRSAYGWSLTEAAEQISTYAARTGLDNGATVAMTAAHLCEHENWPGEGHKRSSSFFSVVSAQSTAVISLSCSRSGIVPVPRPLARTRSWRSRRWPVVRY